MKNDLAGLGVAGFHSVHDALTLIGTGHQAVGEHEDRLIEIDIEQRFGRRKLEQAAVLKKPIEAFLAEIEEVIELPVPVRNQLVLNQAPQVKQLETIVDSYERFGVLLAAPLLAGLGADAWRGMWTSRG